MLALGDSWKDMCSAEATAPSDSLFLGAVYKYTYSLTHSRRRLRVASASM